MTVYYPKMNTAHDLQASALFCLSNFGFLQPKHWKLWAHCSVFKMPCSKQLCRDRKCIDWPSILHFVFHTCPLCATTSWDFVSWYWKEKYCGQPKCLMLSGWIPFYFCMGDTWHLWRWKIAKWKRHSQKLWAFWRTPISNEVVFCPSSVVLKPWNSDDGVMKERSGSGLQISVMEYSPVKVYTAFLCNFYLRIINPNIINAQNTN